MTNYNGYSPVMTCENPKNPGGLRPSDPRYYYTIRQIILFPYYLSPPLCVQVRGGGRRGGINMISLILSCTVRYSSCR